MTAALRVCLSGRISYHALFNWIRPGLCVTTMLGSPLFQILFFTYLGLCDEPRRRLFIVGNAVQVSAMRHLRHGDGDRERAVVRNARHCSRRRRTGWRSSGTCAAFIANGSPYRRSDSRSAGSSSTSARAGSLPALAAVVTVTVASCTALGMLVGSIGLRARDVFFAANLVYFLMLLVCGVNVPVDELPAWLEWIAYKLPMTHGIEAAREIADGASLTDVSDLVAAEALIGAVYALAAYALFRLFEHEGRRRGSLETF
jgi:ABC-2 type transport system permease protein